jgi:hypothetical protein
MEIGRGNHTKKRKIGCFQRLVKRLARQFFVSHLGIFGGCIGLFGVLLSAILHSTFGGSRFDLFRRDTDPDRAHLNGAGIVFRIATALALVPLVPYHFLLSKMVYRRRKKKATIAFAFFSVSALGMGVTVCMPSRGDVLIGVCVVCFSLYIVTSFLSSFEYTSLVDGFVDSIVMPVFFFVPMACSCFVLAVATAYDVTVFGMVAAVTRTDDDGLASRRWWFLAFELLYLVSIYSWILSLALETCAAEKIAWNKRNAKKLKEIRETVV